MQLPEPVKRAPWHRVRQEGTRGGWPKSLKSMRPEHVNSLREEMLGEYGGRRGGWYEDAGEAREEYKPTIGRRQATAEAVTQAFAVTGEGMRLRKEDAEDDGGTYEDRLAELVADPPPFVADPDHLPLFYSTPLPALRTREELEKLEAVMRKDFIIIGVDPGYTNAVAGSASSFTREEERVSRFFRFRPSELQEELRVESRVNQSWRNELWSTLPGAWEETEGEDKDAREARRQAWITESIASNVVEVLRYSNRSTRAGARRRVSRLDSIRRRAYEEVAELIGLKSMAKTISPRPSSQPPLAPPLPSPSELQPLDEATYLDLSSTAVRGLIVFIGSGGKRQKGEKLKGIHAADFGTKFWRGFMEWARDEGWWVIARLISENLTSQLCPLIRCLEELWDGSSRRNL